jgi:cytochrome c
MRKKRVGPPLNGVVGRAFAGDAAFNYSPAMRDMAADGKIWDDPTLDAYLKKPKEVVPKGRMAFPGFPDGGLRADVIAYLKQFNADGSMAK